MPDRLIETYALIKMGDDAWGTGDRHLMSVSVTQAMDARASSCEFQLDDPGLAIASKYLELSQAQGGIVGLPEDKSTTATTSSTNFSGGGTYNGSLSPNMKAYLDMLAYAEGTSGADGYRTIFTGKTFTDMSKHPRDKQCSGSLCSDAAGRYQFLSTTWDGLGLPDFTPSNQDIGAVKLIDQDGALNDVESGNISAAIAKNNTTWASLPGSPYGQPTKTEAELLEVYNKALAKYKGQPSATAPQAASTVGSTPIIETKATEIKSKGAEITIGLGFYGKAIAEFTFTHTSTDVDVKAQTVTFRGQSIRWQINRRIKNTAYQDITFKELANKIATENGVKLEFLAPDVKFKHIDQTQLTDYQFLHREAKQMGFQIAESKDNKTLIIREPQVKASGFVIRYGENLAEGIISDRALSDLQPVQDGTTVSQPTQSTTKSEAKWKIDPKSGTMRQEKPEQATTPQKTASGAKSQSVKGYHPDTIISPDIPPTLPQLPSTTTTTTTTTATASSTTTTASSSTLVNATARRERTQRVKGLPSTFTMTTTPEALNLEPGQSLNSEGFGVALDRAWVIDTLNHVLQNGTLKTTIGCYSPMSAPVRSPTASLSDPLPGSTDGSNLPQIDGWQWPIAGTVAGQNQEFGYGRGRLHAGIDIGGPPPDIVYAANSGVVDYAQNNSPGATGYGNLVIIKHDKGYETYYAHLDSIGVSVGQQVKVGQQIGVRGNTGTRDIHLHFEVRKDGQPVDPRTVLPKEGAPPNVG